MLASGCAAPLMYAVATFARSFMNASRSTCSTSMRVLCSRRRGPQTRGRSWHDSAVKSDADDRGIDAFNGVGYPPRRRPSAGDAPARGAPKLGDEVEEL